MTKDRDRVGDIFILFQEIGGSERGSKGTHRMGRAGLGTVARLSGGAAGGEHPSTVTVKMDNTLICPSANAVGKARLDAGQAKAHTPPGLICTRRPTRAGRIPIGYFVRLDACKMNEKRSPQAQICRWSPTELVPSSFAMATLAALPIKPNPLPPSL